MPSTSSRLIFPTSSGWDSPTWRSMETLAARGNTAEALLVYDALRQRLRDELGATPSAQTKDLHRRLLG